MKKLLFVLLIIVSSVFILGGCGSKEDKSGSNKEATDKAGALAAIQEKGMITIGIEGAFPPFNYFDENNELIGFDVDIATEIADRMGVKPEFIPTPWDTIIGGLQAKKYDVIISSVAPTEERKAKVDFTDSYYTTGVQLFTTEDSEIKEIEDVKGKVIGVATGTTFAEEAESLGAEAKFYDSDLLTFQDLSNGRIDAVITDKAVGNRIILEHNYPFKTVGALLYTEQPGITLNKNQEDLKEELNKVLSEMKVDGTYEEISHEWFGENIE